MWPDPLIVETSTDAVKAAQAAFYVALPIGFAAVLIDAIAKYDQHEIVGKISTFDNIRPSMLASSSAYRQSWTLYIFSRILLYLIVAIGLPLLLLPKYTNYEEIKTLSEPAYFILTNIRDVVQTSYWPLIWGLASAGVIDNIPFLKNIETVLRKFALTVAFIPRGVHVIYGRISSANFEPKPDFLDGARDNRFLKTLHANDFKQPRGTLESKWARFSAILYMLDSRNPEGLRSRFIEEYHELYVNIEDAFRGLETRIQLHRSVQSGDLDDYPELLNQVRDSLRTLPDDLNDVLKRAEFLLACAIPTAQIAGRKSRDKLIYLGFKAEDTELDLLGNVFASIVVIAFAAFLGAILSHLITSAIGSVFPNYVLYPDPSAQGPQQTAIQIASIRLLFDTTVMAMLFAITFTAGRSLAKIDATRPHEHDIANRSLIDYVYASVVGVIAAYLVLIGLIFVVWGNTSHLGAVLIWMPRLLLLSIIAQILVYGPHLSYRDLMRQSILWSIVDIIAVFVSSLIFFQLLNTDITQSALLGQAVYYSLSTLAITPALLFIFTLLAHRRRAVMIVTRSGETEISAANALER